ncbi:class I SAM-dependent methyltransferase [Streptomyces sp. NPDC006544]|uniref:class I SAM-dependent methyltransferase n=1 Tax=Streptomyces sp. NPDC006544 TaxID=3154583 RepID=UPI0033A806FD
MPDYDAEADDYDASRGGAPRAEAAAAAVLGLLPAAAATLLDLGCGTGIATARIAAGRPGTRVLGADVSSGMAAMARSRGVPVVLGSGTRLPVRTGSLDAVSAIWLLHLLRRPGTVAALIAEVGRALRPGGVFLTTVDKDDAHDVGSDIDALLAPHLTGARITPRELADRLGLLPGQDVPRGEPAYRLHGFVRG